MAPQLKVPGSAVLRQVSPSSATNCTDGTWYNQTLGAVWSSALQFECRPKGLATNMRRTAWEYSKRIAKAKLSSLAVYVFYRRICWVERSRQKRKNYSGSCACKTRWFKLGTFTARTIKWQMFNSKSRPRDLLKGFPVCLLYYLSCGLFLELRAKEFPKFREPQGIVW